MSLTSGNGSGKAIVACRVASHNSTSVPVFCLPQGHCSEATCSKILCKQFTETVVAGM